MRLYFNLIIIIPTLLSFGSCQKDTSVPGEDIIKVALVNEEEDDTLRLNLNQEAELLITLENSFPTARIDLTVEGGTIDGKTSLTNLTPQGVQLLKTFVPDNQVGKAFITASITNSNYSNTLEIVILNEVPEKIFTSDFPGSTLSINISEEMNFSVLLNPEFTERTVKFTFGGGIIKGNNGPITSEFEVNDIDGIWYGTIVADSSLNEGNYPIVFTIGEDLYTHQTNFWLYKEDVSNVLTLSVTTVGPVLADELSTFNVEATINNHNAQEITFNSSSGKFSNGTSSITLPISGGTVNTNITTTQSVSTHNITAELVNPGYSESVTFTTSASLPETLELVPSAWNIDSNAVNSSSAISFTAYLNRINGKVSTDLNVSAEAFQLLNGTKTNFGTFVSIPITSTISETATSDFYGSTGMYPDSTLFVVFTTQGVSGVLSDTVSLNVYAP